MYILPDTSNELDDNTLINQINSGNFSALSILFSRYLSMVRFWADKASGDYIETEDLIQEGLIALYSAVRVYDFSSASFATFASVCVKRSIISAVRHASLKKQIPAQLIDSLDSVKYFSNDNPEVSFINKESYASFSDKIKLTLSSFEYDVLTRYLRCGNYEEICESLNVTRKKVDNALQRARKKIKKLTVNC